MRSEMDGLVGRSSASPLPMSMYDDRHHRIVPPRVTAAPPWASEQRGRRGGYTYCYPYLDGAMAGSWLHGPCQAARFCGTRGWRDARLSHRYC